MKVSVSGYGMVEFPDTMSEGDVREVLKQFEKKPDDTIPKLLETLEKLLKQKPQIITEERVVEVEKQVVVKVPEVKIVETEKLVQSEPNSWHFTANKDDLGEWNVIAEPFNG